MPIISLRDSFESEKVKRLRSITFGDAGAQKPYITKGLPPVNSQATSGYGPYSDGANTSQVSARVDDLSRIAQMLKDKPGQKFLQNQAVLQFSTQQGNLLKKALGGALSTVKVVGSTLAQVPVNGTGTHFVLGFGGTEYLKEGNPGSTVLASFLRTNLGIGNQGVNGAARALQGTTIIPDNEGQANYQSFGESGLLDRNSKFDLTAGQDDNPYLRGDLKEVFNLVKGLFTKREKDKAAGLPTNLGNIFKSNPLNLGQDGFRTEKDSPEIEIQSELKGPETPDSHLSTQGFREIDGRNLVKGTPEGTNTKIIVDNNGGRGYTPQSPDTLSNKQSTDIINVNGKELPIRPDIDPTTGYTGKDGQVDTSTTGIESKVVEQQTTGITSIPLAGRQLASLGTEYNGIAEGYVTSEVDDEGGVTITQGESYAAGTVPATNLRSLQSQYGTQESFDLGEGGPISIATGKGSRSTKLIDFRKVRKDSRALFETGIAKVQNENGFDSTTDLTGINYATQDIQVRLKMGGANRNISGSIAGLIRDEVNLYDIGEQSQEILQADIIPFQFNVFSPNESAYIYFRAFLEDFSDDYTGDWAGTKYIGRAEEFYTYQGFKRDISFSFKIAAFSKEDLKPLYNKLNYLAGSTAPTYAGNGQFMRGTLTAITVGDYLTNQNGFISKVGLKWDKSYPWEIDLFNENLPRVPHILDVSISFTPIHDFNVKTNINTAAGESYFAKQR